MGILNTVAAKLMGMPTIDELAGRRVGAIANENNLRDYRLSMYKFDREQIDPRFYERVYVGTATQNGQEIGLLIRYSEATGYTSGHIVGTDEIEQHKEIFKKYKMSKKSPLSSLYSGFLYELGEIEELTVPE